MCVYAPAQEGGCAIGSLRSATSLRAPKPTQKKSVGISGRSGSFTGLGDSGTLRFVCNTSRCRRVLRVCVIVARTRDSIKEHL